MQNLTRRSRKTFNTTTQKDALGIKFSNFELYTSHRHLYAKNVYNSKRESNRYVNVCSAFMTMFANSCASLFVRASA